jgi:hypothetical protein
MVKIRENDDQPSIFLGSLFSDKSRSQVVRWQSVEVSWEDLRKQGSGQTTTKDGNLNCAWCFRPLTFTFCGPKRKITPYIALRIDSDDNMTPSDGENDGMTISLLWRGPGGCQNLEPRYHYRVPKHAEHQHVCSFESIIEQMLWRKSQQERARICFSQGTAANWPSCTLSSFDQTWNVFDDTLKSPISVDVVESLPPHQAQVWLTFDLRSNFIRLDLATIGQMGDSAMRHLGI